jgi:UDP-N-acetylglucosamine/UDP-N-acetylgalactosamine diphosphorylase
MFGNFAFPMTNIKLYLFLRSHENELKHHVAHKKIPYINENGLRVFPKDNNGIKLEKFVFDVFSFAKNFLIWEVPRDMEFSPLKNSDADKKETPTTCRNDLYDEHARWLANAGAMLVGEREEMKFEISPLVSYHGEDLSELVSGRVLRGPLQIELHNDQVLFNGLDIEEYVKQ